MTAREWVVLRKAWKSSARIKATPENSRALARLARLGLIRPLPSKTLEETAQYFQDVAEKAEEIRKERRQEYKRRAESWALWLPCIPAIVLSIVAIVISLRG